MTALTPSTITTLDASNATVTLGAAADGSSNQYQKVVAVGDDGTPFKVDSGGHLLVASSGGAATQFGQAIGTVAGTNTTAAYTTGQQIGSPTSVPSVAFDVGGGDFAAAVRLLHVDDDTRLIDSLAVVVLAIGVGSTDATVFAPAISAAPAVQAYLPCTKTLDLGSGKWNRWEPTLPAGDLVFGSSSTSAVIALVGTTTAAFTGTPAIYLTVVTTSI